MERVISFFGLIVMLFLAWLLSNNKRRMDWRVIVGGLLLQFALALIVLKTAPGRAFFSWANDFVGGVVALSDEGARFVFGEKFTDHFFAFKVLPTIIFISSLSYLLFYWGFLQKIVQFMAWGMYKVMGCSGSESLCVAANVFLGQTEAPIFVRPYLATMTQSEIMCMMVGGMATVAGGVLAAYVGFGISAGHLLASSLMSAPAALLIAKIIWPETEESPTKKIVKVDVSATEVNAFEAACRGASDGLMLCLNVAAMLIAFIALIALVNLGLSAIGQVIGFDVSFQQILGWFFQPLAFVMGVPWEDCMKIGQLLGERMVLNEFVAYVHLGEMMKAGVLSERGAIIATYALCGFANFSSIAIQIGGIGSLEPRRKADFARAGFKAMLGGTLTSFTTACIAGILL
jgi:CNT family concentrative nucleoside transporter